MVYNKITKIKFVIFLLFVACCLFLTFAFQRNTETNLLKAILPQNIIENTNMVNIADKSGSFIRVVYEAEDDEELNNLKNSFENEIISTSFQRFSPEINNLLEVYTTKPTIFLSKTVRDLLKKKNYASIKEMAITELYNPISIQLVDFDKDPYFLLNNFIMSHNIKTQPYTMQNGRFYDYEILTLKGNDSLSPGLIRQDIKNLIAIQKHLSVKGKYIYLAGTPIHTYYTSESASISINIICVLATLLIMALTYLYFKNIKMLIPIALSILLGFWVGFIVTKIIFPTFHIITLVFSTTLIGIGIDYSYHYLFSDKKLDKDFLKNITLSMFSTIIAFLILYFSNIKLLKQISIFTIFGLITIYLVVILLYPCIEFPNPKRIFHLKISKQVKLYFSIILAIILVGGYFRIAYNDTLTAFYIPTKKLKKAEILYDKISKQNGTRNYIIETEGIDLESILEHEELIKDELNVREISCIAISNFIPSKKRQKENIKLVHNLYKNNLDTYNDLLSADQISKLKTQKTSLISLDLNKNEYLKTFLIDDNHSIMFANGQTELPVLQNKYSKVIDINAECSTYLLKYRNILNKLIPLVFVIVFTVLCIIYNIKSAIKILSPSVIGATSSIAIISMLGQTINLFSLIAVFLILGFTIDYSVFREKGGDKSEEAILISCITTAFSFFALSFTSFKFISSLSSVLFLGILISYIVGLMLFSKD